MARLARLVVPGYPHHIVQRGNNRQAIFVDDTDRERFLAVLADSATRFDLPIHAFVLMPNHVHLLATPASETSLAGTMQAIGRSYARWFNKRHQRTGTLFEGRFRSSVVETDRYALACMRYIEMNPVRAALVAEPSEFRWSSHLHHIGTRKSALVSEHSLYWSLGNTPFERQAAYTKLFELPLGEAELAPIRASIQGGWAVGRPWGVGSQPQIQRRPERLARGRPRADSKN
jgi:putative transposase